MRRTLKTLCLIALIACFASVALADVSMPEGIVPSLPIYTEPVTLTIGIGYDAFCAHEGNVVLEEIQQQTGINIEWIEYSDDEQVSLMFASREYPDIMIRIGSDQAKADAIAAGDIIALDEYKDKLPNVYAFYDLYPELYSKSLTNGHLYGTPYISLDEVSYGLRDCWNINRTWLDEVGLDIPTTATEFLEALRAFKANAGTGSIPADAIPCYFRYDQRIGGQFDIVCAFGVYAMDASYDCQIDGEYIYQAVNPDLKDAIKFLTTMYAEGLIPTSIFTDDSPTYYNYVNSNPPMVGLAPGYWNNDNYCMGGNFYPFAPFDNELGRESYTRTQPKGVTAKNRIMITSKCEDLDAALALIDYFEIPEVSMKLRWGAEGYGWYYDENGVATVSSAWVRDLESSRPYNAIETTMITTEWYQSEAKNQEGSREWAINNIYGESRRDWTVPKLSPDLLSEADEIRRTDLKTEILNYVSKTIAGWIMGEGDIDAEWDAFVARQYELGLEEYLDLCQAQLDAYNED